jgi:hypothetical protein
MLDNISFVLMVLGLWEWPKMWNEFSNNKYVCNFNKSLIGRDRFEREAYKE